MPRSRSSSSDAPSIESATSPQIRRVRAYKGASDDEEMASDASSEALESATEAPPNDDLATISFGALIKAQSALGKRRRRSSSSTDPTEDQPPEPFSTTPHHPPRPTHPASSEALERRAGKKDHRDFSRPSKHAPTELSAKKAVSRKRSVIHLPRRQSRDPRFEPAVGRVDDEKVKRNYAFLDSYRDNEIAELKAGLKREKDAGKREVLKKALTSMESRRKTQQLKEQRQEVVRLHRREERAKVAEGKKPFYLKRGEIKERALKERFRGMKSKQVDKVIERRRKKLTAKERKGMPLERRG
ncbi:MAG: rRNA biogenesis protein rrp36 [Ramalina farinacea]|uniref:rRNA biogenesis protein RRP36 n=1 Tax=Ramalina farinacea TaxID=258253 RepID=A0AA43TXP3_9LECA|nr:rRNA biogenesis protein rrp36 [Ramalina farinacea]